MVGALFKRVSRPKAALSTTAYNVIGLGSRRGPVKFEPVRRIGRGTEPILPASAQAFWARVDTIGLTPIEPFPYVNVKHAKPVRIIALALHHFHRMGFDFTLARLSSAFESDDFVNVANVAAFPVIDHADAGRMNGDVASKCLHRRPL